MALVDALAPGNWNALSGVYQRDRAAWSLSRADLEGYIDPYRTFTLAGRYAGGVYTMPDEEVNTGGGWQPYAWNYRFVFVLPVPAVVSEISTTSAPVSGYSDPPRLHVVYEDGTRSQHDGTGNTNSFTPNNKAVDFFYFEGWDGYPQGCPFSISALSIDMGEPPDQLQVDGELELVSAELDELQVTGLFELASGFANELRLAGELRFASSLYNELALVGVLRLGSGRFGEMTAVGKLELAGDIAISVGAYIEVAGELRLATGLPHCWCGHG